MTPLTSPASSQFLTQIQNPFPPGFGPVSLFLQLSTGMAQGCPSSLKPLLIVTSFQRPFPDLSSWTLFPITLLLYNAPVTIKIHPKLLSFSTTLILATIPFLPTSVPLTSAPGHSAVRSSWAS